MRTCLLVIVLSVALFLMSAPGATAQRYSAWSTPTVFDEVNTSSALEFASDARLSGLTRRLSRWFDRERIVDRTSDDESPHGLVHRKSCRIL